MPMLSLLLLAAVGQEADPRVLSGDELGVALRRWVCSQEKYPRQIFSIDLQNDQAGRLFKLWRSSGEIKVANPVKRGVVTKTSIGDRVQIDIEGMADGHALAGYIVLQSGNPVVTFTLSRSASPVLPTTEPLVFECHGIAVSPVPSEPAK